MRASGPAKAFDALVDGLLDHYFVANAAAAGRQTDLDICIRWPKWCTPSGARCGTAQRANDLCISDVHHSVRTFAPAVQLIKLGR